MNLGVRRKKALGRPYFTGHYLRQQLAKSSSTRPWHVIALVREPIARNLSAFFHAIDAFYPGFDTPHGESKSAVYGELAQAFLTKYPHDMPSTWFDAEMGSVFGIDVFSTEFPKTKGYAIYEGEKARLLLMRLEDMDGCAREAFRDFLAIEQFAVVRANVASTREYGAIYQEFLGSLVLPDAFVDRMYASKYARHFYSEEEIEGFRARWSAR
jgi:hypothetical protein